MATGIAQKIWTALFPLWSLRKNDTLKMKKATTKKQRENVEKIERNFNI